MNEYAMNKQIYETGEAESEKKVKKLRCRECDIMRMLSRFTDRAKYLLFTFYIQLDCKMSLSQSSYGSLEYLMIRHCFKWDCVDFELFNCFNVLTFM